MPCFGGFLARQWGNDLFRRPEAFESFCLAVREHDNGWGEWALSPYPFRKNPMPISILTRRVPKRIYGDELDFHGTLASAPYFAVDFTLHAMDEIGRTRSAVA
jgi:hypothetical protein